MNMYIICILYVYINIIYIYNIYINIIYMKVWDRC